MEAVYECKEQRLQKDFRHSIVARDEHGYIVGTYYGFWAPGLRTVTLYPDYNHPAYKPGWKLSKKRVYDGFIRCTVKPTIVSIASSKPEPKGVGFPGASGTSSGGSKGETWRDRKLPMHGQERMKI